MATSERVRKSRLRRKRAMLISARNKMSVTFGLFVFALIVLSIRILFINYDQGEAYSKIVLNHQSYTSTTLPYKRGQILDSNGTVLAYSEKVYNLILDPKVLLSYENCKDSTLNALVQCFGLEREYLENLLATESTSQYEKLLKELTEDDIAEFMSLKQNEDTAKTIKGVWFEESYIRKYPYGQLACDVLGFASTANGGELGLERQYNDELSGIDGALYSYVNEDVESQSVQKNAVDGYNIVTTLDYKIQSAVESNILKVMSESPATAAGVVVMNPNNGEVLAMASYPFFDLNNPRDLSGVYTEEELKNMDNKAQLDAMYALWSNYCVSAIFEPGSTFKPFVVAAGLEEGVIKDGDKFTCLGNMKIANYTINCHMRKGHGVLDVSGGLEQSCNPCMMQIGALIGTEKFPKYQSLFGFGGKTGIDLPGEEIGIVYSNNMTNLDLACISFGQNVNVTMIQMCAAYASLMNGGNYYQPHMVKRIEKASGEVVSTNSGTLVKQTITEETSALINKYLRAVVEEGTGGEVKITGYDIGGKTGTAQKIPREDKKWVMSFIGGVPMDNPQYLVFSVVDEPYGTTGTNNYSSDAKKIFKGLMNDLLPYMGIYKDTQEEESTKTDIPVDTGVELPNMDNAGSAENETQNATEGETASETTSESTSQTQ
ncbi:MAG: penicillin-binding protein 2 [Lachnospira sp.]|nr:penicillin-binding protein 2 [Lachnospira sp.]